MSPEERERFQEESAGFTGFLARWLPDYRRTRRRVALSPETPEGVRLFWEAVGHGSALRRVITSPAEASGQRRVRALLAQWRRRGLEGAVVAGRLPACFRLVEELEGGFRITDESNGGDDAPVLDVSDSVSEPMSLAPSYIYFTTNKLLRLVFSRWFNLQASFTPEGEARPFPRLQPNLIQYGEELFAWADSLSPDSPPRMLAFRDFRGLIQHVQGLQGQTLERCPRPPGHILQVSGFATLADMLPRLRHFQHGALGPVEPEQGGEIHHWVGNVEGLPIWLMRQISGPREELQAGVDPDDREQWVARLSARGVRLLDELPPR